MNSAGTTTASSQESPRSSRIAIRMPPTIMIGTVDRHRAGHQHEHLHLLHVVGVAGDQRRRAELRDLAAGERADPVEDRRAQVAAERPSRYAAPNQTATTEQAICTSETPSITRAGPDDVAGVAAWPRRCR